MPVLSDPRHERFAQLLSEKRMTNAAAYRQAAGKPEASTGVACSMAEKWLRRVDVSSRIAELKAETASHCAISREELVRDLVAMFHSKPEDASLSNPLCETLVTRGQRIPVFPQKMPVVSQLIKVLGYDAPTKIELEAGENLESFLGRLFGARRTLGDSGNGNGQQASVTAARR